MEFSRSPSGKLRLVEYDTDDEEFRMCEDAWEEALEQCGLARAIEEEDLNLIPIDWTCRPQMPAGIIHSHWLPPKRSDDPDDLDPEMPPAERKGKDGKWLPPKRSQPEVDKETPKAKKQKVEGIATAMTAMEIDDDDEEEETTEEKAEENTEPNTEPNTEKNTEENTEPNTEFHSIEDDDDEDEDEESDPNETSADTVILPDDSNED